MYWITSNKLHCNRLCIEDNLWWCSRNKYISRTLFSSIKNSVSPLGPAPSSSQTGCIGCVTQGTVYAPGFSVNKDIATIAIPTPGVYLCFFTMSVNYTSKPTKTIVSISPTSTVLPLPTLITGMADEINAAASSVTSSFVAPITTSGNLILLFELIGTVNSVSVGTYFAVRVG